MKARFAPLFPVFAAALFAQEAVPAASPESGTPAAPQAVETQVSEAPATAAGEQAAAPESAAPAPEAASPAAEAPAQAPVAEAPAPAPEAAAAAPAPAPEEKKAEERPVPAPLAPPSEERLSTSGNNTFQDVEIFGDNWLFSPTIWSDMLHMDDADAMVQKNIEEKKFANDEYFMRNVDREEFEEERVLLMFEEKARRYEKYLKKMRAEIAADSAAAAGNADSAAR